ncbi:hypothetical protein MalM25_18670 [Planctomycetes bacterium MalM25]|nr:hypothetical protein MalM25_18670 [Planctomycetes bacterium MalM25]
MDNSHLQAELAAQSLQAQTRRSFLGNSVSGMGAMWLAALGADRAGASASPPAAALPATAKRIIYLHMVGGPSQLELFDYKPQLAKFDGKLCPEEYLEGERFAFIQGRPRMLGPQFDFQQHGESGAWVSDRMPELAKRADQLCFVKTLQTDQFNHAPAQLMVHTGNARTGYPSIGSWVTWGLGTSNENLPGFMVLLSGGVPRNGKALWSSGFLPSVYQGVQCRPSGDPILNISNPKSTSRDVRRKMLDTLKSLNEQSYDDYGDPETLTRISQYEMAFRMQMTAPQVSDLSDEPQHVLDAYGVGEGKKTNAFARNCILARRLAESGVRYIQLYDMGWDSHGAAKTEAINGGFKDKCDQTDRPISALLDDLQSRGMLEDTLVVWSGEFGRTPMRENRGGVTMQYVGRDHSPSAFTAWMAGGGVKPGFTYGETDEFGYRPANDPVHLRDFHATLLRLLGVDHQRYSVYFQGLNQKLTGVKPAKVLQEIIA